MQFKFSSTGFKGDVIDRDFAAEIKQFGKQNQEYWPTLSTVRDQVNMSTAKIPIDTTITVTVDVNIDLVVDVAEPAPSVLAEGSGEQPRRRRAPA